MAVEVTGSGDHALSEPEVQALVKALVARPNVCGYNAYHTNGGVLLRPSSVKSDSDLPPNDVYVWQEVKKNNNQAFSKKHSLFL